MSVVTPVLDVAAPMPVRASRERVDVWQAALALDPSAAEAALRMLCDAERARAARLRVGADRWVAARATLRRVLGGYLDLAPERVAFAVGTDGKPGLDRARGMDLRFNLSHSGDVALVAVRLGHEVGVDVEMIRDGVDGAAIAADRFSARERADLAERGVALGREAFFRAWVRHEALAKASGRGIASPARDCDAARFSVRELNGISGCVAAVASTGDTWTVLRVRSGD